jgi:RecJ-like exonuclease
MTPFTGTPCICKPGQERKDCPICDGTGRVMNSTTTRERHLLEHAEGAHEGHIIESCPECRKEGH